MKAINAGKYKDNNFPGWITTIGKYYFINIYREAKKNPIVHPDDITAYVKGIETSPEQVLIKNESREIFDETVTLLPKRLKDAMELWLDDVPYTEASDRLNIKLGTYKSRAFFAKKELKKHYM
jgi:RNA polymerase sigma-70 factor (ECF subfamily)